MSRALEEAEQNAKAGVLEHLPKDRNTALRPEENPNGHLPAPSTLSSSKGSTTPTLPPRSPIIYHQAVNTATLTPDAKFQIIEAELANCKMTREALARREAALRERKAEIVRETKMRLDKEVRELAMRDEDDEGDEGLYMRYVQRRVEASVGRADENTNEETKGGSQQVEEDDDDDEVKEEKVTPMSAPERRRLARLALFKHDPRLG